jgi:ATP-binding cassette subfamily B protein
MSGDEFGGFSDVRQQVDGHAMLGLLAYARPYWDRLTLGVLASLVTRLSRLVPPIVVGAAIDRAVRDGGAPGLLATVGLLTADPVTGEAARLALLQRLPPRRSSATSATTRTTTCSGCRWTSSRTTRRAR